MSVQGLELQWQVGNETGEAVLERMTVAFERLGAGLADFEKYTFPKVIGALEEEARGQFGAEGGGPSGPWASLSPAYAAWKEQAYPGQGILRRTDKLFEALTSSSSPFARRVVTSSTLDYGTLGVEYASFHQLGTDVLQARPPFDFGDEMNANLTRAMAEGAREAITDSGVEQFAEVSP